MERNTLKHHSRSGVGRSMKDINNINDSRFKESWEYSGSSEGDLLSGFHPWPPRSYGCTFCKREFRSAQALGGHMNVHRRDRARLRQSPPQKVDFPFLNLNLNTNPNPNPKPNPSHQNHGYPPLTPSTLIPMGSHSPSPSSLSALSSPSSASPGGIKKWVMLHNKRGGMHVERSRAAKSLVGVGKFDGLTQDGGFGVVRNAGIVRLDLEIGLVADSKEDLDLELRLGRS